jgi:hypothetical protein
MKAPARFSITNAAGEELARRDHLRQSIRMGKRLARKSGADVRVLHLSSGVNFTVTPSGIVNLNH